MTTKRTSFSKVKHAYPIPNLLEVQINSFNDFVQMGVGRTKRKDQGLQEVFTSVFPIESYDGNHKMEFVSYSLGKPKYDLNECKSRGMSYAAALKLKLRLRSGKDIKEQEVYLGDLPLMTPVGTFIINGDERVIVSQLHRSPGVSFESEIHPNGKKIYSARIIPYRGAWLEFEFDAYDTLHAYIDRRKKVLVTVLLRALGYSKDEDILKLFSDIEEIKSPAKKDYQRCIGLLVAVDVIDEETGVTLMEQREKNYL